MANMSPTKRKLGGLISKNNKRIKIERDLEFNPDVCIFCNKTQKRLPNRKYDSIILIKESFSRAQIIEASEIKNDQRMITFIERGVFENCEAKYHKVCRNQYTKIATKTMSQDRENGMEDKENDRKRGKNDNSDNIPEKHTEQNSKFLFETDSSPLVCFFCKKNLKWMKGSNRMLKKREKLIYCNTDFVVMKDAKTKEHMTMNEKSVYHPSCRKQYIRFPECNIETITEEQQTENSVIHTEDNSQDENDIEDEENDKAEKHTLQNSTLLCETDSPPLVCTFCKKNLKWINSGIHRMRENLIHCNTDSVLIEAAKTKDNITMNEKSMYHPSCRKRYTRIPNLAPDDNQIRTEEGHHKAFEFISNYVQTRIVDGLYVESTSMLKERYLLFLTNHYPDLYNDNYKTYKLKDKLIKQFENEIDFWQPNSQTDEIVFSTKLLEHKEHAVAAALNYSNDEKKIKECALILRSSIQKYFKNEPKMPWPPSPKYLLSRMNEFPKLLDIFFSNVLSGKEHIDPSTRINRLVISFCHDLCFTVTKGKWQMPKQLLLGISFRHLTGRKKIVGYLNRFGHCVSNDVLLRLETAMSDSASQTEFGLPAGALKFPKFTHFCWDNFDLNEETPDGFGTTHSTHGIIIQERRFSEERVTGPKVEKTRKRSVDYTPEQPEPFFSRGKSEPNISHEQETVFIKEDIKEIAMKRNFLWILCRMNLELGILPCWKGWISTTSESAGVTESVVTYMPAIHQSVNDLSTIQKILQISQTLSTKLGQQYTFVTFDLAAAKKAYEIVWGKKEVFKNVFILLGAFHTMLSYIGALGKSLRGSGFEEIVIEAGLCATGSLERVMNGTHYNRCFKIHTVMVEACERFLFTSFVDWIDQTDQENVKKLLDKIKLMTSDLSYVSAKHILSSDEFNVVFLQYENYKTKVRTGSFGKTAQFWIQYIDRVWVLLRFSLATRTNDFDLHIASLQDMCPLLFCQNHHNYAKYISHYIVMLRNLPVRAQLLLKDNGFSVCRSQIPAARTPIDLAIEQTINRDAKTQGGIIGFSRNQSAYHRWCVTRHIRASYIPALNEIANVETSSNEMHKEFRKSNIRNSESAVDRAMKAFTAYLNPFNGDMAALVRLSSGQCVSDETAIDILDAEKKGKIEFEEFVKTRLVEKTLDFHEPVKKFKMKTFQSISKVAVVKSSNKTIQITAQRNLFGQLLVLSQMHDIELQKVLMYPLSPVPWAFATSDGLPLKTNKSTLLHKLLDKSCIVSDDVYSMSESVAIVDGNALLHCIQKIPDTYGQLAHTVFSALPKTTCVHFVTDTYVKNSIKNSERMRRGSTENTYLLKGPSTVVPRNWKAFLTSEKNKKELINFLLNQWKEDSFAKKLNGRKIFFVNEEECVLLYSTDGKFTTSVQVGDLCSTQEEADTRIILHAIYVSKQLETRRIVVRSPDTDVFLLLLSFRSEISKSLYFDTGTGNNRRIINISQLADTMPLPLRKAILGLHAFTGCDSTSCFAGRGKLKALKLLQKNDQYIDTFSRLGTIENTSMDDQLVLETFVCELYAKPQYKSVNEIRVDEVLQKFKSKNSLLSRTSGMDLCRLPPCKEVLLLHIQRVNFQTFIWRNAAVSKPSIPEPCNNGWIIGSSGILEIKWYSGDFLPTEIKDILSGHTFEEEDFEQSLEEQDLLEDSDDNTSDDDSDVE